MKLKYILPFATIASIASVATPLTTSCSKGKTGYTCSWKKGQGEYLPIDPKKDGSVPDVDTLTVVYHDDLTGINKKIFSDDMVYSIYKKAEAGGDSFDLNKISFTTKKIYDVETSGKGIKFFRFDGKILFDGIIKEGASTLEFEKRTFTIKNMPITCEYSKEPSSHTNVGFVNDDMKQEDTKYSITMPEIVKTGGKFIVYDSNKTYNRDAIKEIMDKDQEWANFISGFIWGHLLSCTSNYFQDITVGPTK